MKLLMREKGSKRILIAKRGSILSMRECILFEGQHLSPFELEGSFGSFVNISIQQNVEAPDTCSSPTTTSTQTTCLMNSCSFSSVFDVYDGGIVTSLNNPLASLSVSNTSFVWCCRTRNVKCEGTSEVSLKPDRQNETTDGANAFIWCEWNGSKTTGTNDSWMDITSNGGAICIYRDATYPRGNDAIYYDNNNLYFDSGNPFYECYTTNADDKRICFAYNYSNAGAWTFDQTSKKDWLKDKTIYVSVNGSDGYELCGSNESNPCLTAKKAFEMCEVQISLAITLMEGNHISEATTIEIGEKKISVIGKGKDKSSIGTRTLSSARALF
eukprot:MONOS_6467.1-p1 / transcript=MONOS_6467.1 / gene=MONOS_6467 / organism=Monocercomonoides_exilis_PA203 / gene_product=unspecified product / transcript_product=unspecified product / location=Mono_scaffold00204:9-1710(-) / protein_length=326 / sequence_SO=supercontig / SO=protein_coding / is_pseudo=false